MGRGRNFWEPFSELVFGSLFGGGAGDAITDGLDAGIQQAKRGAVVAQTIPDRIAARLYGQPDPQAERLARIKQRLAEYDARGETVTLEQIEAELDREDEQRD